MDEEYKQHLNTAQRSVGGRNDSNEFAAAHALIAIALLLEQANFIQGNY